jgi:MscS family membrane protein
VLDFSQVEPAPDDYGKVAYVQRLKACIDRLALVDLAKISDDQQADPVRFPPEMPESPLLIARGADGLWRFSAEAVAEINNVWEIVKDKPVMGAVVPAPAVTDSTSAAEAAGAAGREKEEEAEKKPVTDVAVPDELRSARRTMRTLFDSLREQDYSTAVSTLDFAELEESKPNMGPYTRLEYARQLKYIIDRLAYVDYADISDDPQGPPFRFPPGEASQPIEISRGELGIWQFSADTVSRIGALYEVFQNKPVLNIAEEDRSWYAREVVEGNELWRVLALFLSIFLSLVLGQLLRFLVRWRATVLEKRDRSLTAVVYRTIGKTVVGICFLTGLDIGVRALVLDHEVEQFTYTLIRVIFAVVIGYILFRLVDVAVELLRGLAKRSGSTLNDMLVPIVSTSLRLTIIVMVCLEIATTISDKPPSAVLAGLGAGGLAIGLAAQDTIKNFFGSLMIYADRPFELGERIVIDGFDGPVEAVGFRSTRIRTLDGHVVTVPNGELAYKTIQNIGKRPYIRRVMNLRLASNTSPELVQRALDILRDLLDGHEGYREELPPRVFLHDFMETAINVRAIYWYHPPEYWDYCDYSERLNLEVVNRFTTEGIRFALPSQRLFLSQEEGLPGKEEGQRPEAD